MRRWPIARYLFSTHLIFIPLLLVGFYLAAAVLLAVVATITDIRLSAADLGGQILPWFASGYSATASGLLATMLVHGRTRREFLTQYPIFQLLCAPLLAGVTTGVFAVESVVYRALDWTQKVSDQRVYESATDYATIFGAYWSMYLVWMSVGLFFGVAVYRWEAAGGLALLPAAALVIAAGGVSGFFSLPFARTGLDLTAVTVVSVAIAWALLWVSGRDIPLRTRAA